ncbi:MAG: D-alanyl-D-alanine carboxypeptidase/D-alanyl-D-alanine-endopeptidase [Polyangiaceae bacterium]
MRSSLAVLFLSLALAACGGAGDGDGAGGEGGTATGVDVVGGGGNGGGGGTEPVEEDPFEPPPEPAPLSDEALAAIGASIDGILGGFPSQQHTVLVVGADTGQVVYAREPDLPLKPASNTKLFSSAAAFANFGEDHRHETVVYATSPPSGGVVSGDLILMGHHDYTWSTQFYPGPRWPLDRLAERVAAMGITQVTGTVQARFEHLYDGYQFAYYDAAAHRAAAATQFNAALNSAGINTGGASSSPDNDVPAGAMALASWRSLPIHVAASPVNRISHNEFADILSRHVGWELSGTSSYAAGGDAMVDLLAQSGSDVSGLVFYDGSGLSHDNRVSARHLVDLYDLMRSRSEGLAWERTFTVAGIKGTIGGRMGGPNTLGRFRGKTGTLNGVIALSGVLDHRHDGQRYHLAMLMNGVTSNAAARAAHDSIVETVAADHRDLGARPDAPTLTSVVSDANGQSVTVTFDAVDGANGYLVWRSRDGRLWPRSEARLVDGPTHRTLPFDGDDALFVRVSAVGEAGESDPSDTYLAQTATDTSRLLLVDGNDRWQAEPAVENPTAQGHDFLVPYADVLADEALFVGGIDSCDNDAVAVGDCPLDGYDVVVWALGEESTADATLDPDEQDRIEDHLVDGGALLISGAELAWHLGNEGDAADQAFLEDVLHAAYAGDDAATFHVAPTPGDAVAFLTPDRMVVSYPDQLSPTAGSEAFLSYLGGNGGVAGVRSTGNDRVVVLGLPFESIAAVDDRAALMATILDSLGN